MKDINFVYQNILSSTAYQSFPKWLPTYLTPSRNKLLWNFHDYANRHLHEDWGENSFSQLGDERKIPESKQGLGLCSSALAFILEFYNDLWDCGMIFHPRFHGVVRLGKHENFIMIYFYQEWPKVQGKNCYYSLGKYHGLLCKENIFLNDIK